MDRLMCLHVQTSGEPVEVLERQGDQIHVHLPNGTEGWVRKGYLSAEEPLQHRLTERNGEVERLKQDVAKLEGELATARGGASGLSSASAPGPSSASAPGRSALTNTAGVPKAAATGAPSVASDAAPTAPSPPAETNSAENDAPGEPAYFMTPPDTPARPVWHWALGSFVVALGLGFALGWYVLDRRIRRKYGGLRIY